ncbi:MAG: alcohol dehydrogenase catalytic domain-containing protein [Treponema sp.]|jgi:threonine dehydrogenase-like Zn-dependent dehydrogenase|nr:alcohol dehydrogenase catalytic domain-containing protein [Treponema sp.]
MKAAVVKGKCDVVILDIGEPVIQKPSEIKIRVTTGAICNTTDNKVYATDTPEKDWPNDKFPFVIGHECTGRIVETGGGVKNLKIGDRVVYWTVNGRAFADYLVIDTEQSAVAAINNEAPEDIAAIMEMVIGSARLLFAEDAVPMIKKGDAVLVIGLGPAGLIYHRLAKMMGAGKLAGAGRRAFRLETSRKLGADVAVDTGVAGWHGEVVSKLGKKPDVIIDATGGDVVADIIALGSKDTRIIAYGVAPFNWKDRAGELLAADIQMPRGLGLASAKIAAPKCVEWLESGKFGLEPVISHRLSLEETGRGLDMCRLERDTTLKVLIHINDFN